MPALATVNLRLGESLSHDYVKMHVPRISPRPQNKKVKLVRPNILFRRFIIDIKPTNFLIIALEADIIPCECRKILSRHNFDSTMRRFLCGSDLRRTH